MELGEINFLKASLAELCLRPCYLILKYTEASLHCELAKHDESFR